jgi:SMC interacting uncharacterized protein involved in chromosome segregation
MGRTGVDELERIESENRELTRDLERLRADHEALRESVLIWIRLYEGQLQRANSAAALG